MSHWYVQSLPEAWLHVIVHNALRGKRDVVGYERVVFVGVISIMLAEVFADGCAHGGEQFSKLRARVCCTGDADGHVVGFSLKGVILVGVLVVETIKTDDDIRHFRILHFFIGHRNGMSVNRLINYQLDWLVKKKSGGRCQPLLLHRRPPAADYLGTMRDLDGRGLRLDNLDELECLGQAAEVAVHLWTQLSKRKFCVHHQYCGITLSHFGALSINRKANHIMLLVCKVSPVTDADVKVAIGGGNAGRVECIVHVGANLVAIAEAASILDDGAVANLTRDGLGECEFGLDLLRHDQLGLTLEAEVPHGCNLLGEILAEVLIECNLLCLNSSERALQRVQEVGVRVNVQGGELGKTLAELVGYEAEQVECGIVDGAVRYCHRSSHAGGCCRQLCKVDCLLADRLYLASHLKLNIVYTVRPNLITDDTCQQTEVVWEFQTRHLSVNQFVNSEGHSTWCLDVGVGVLIGTAGDFVLQHGGAVVGAFLAHGQFLAVRLAVFLDLLQQFAELLALGLHLAELRELMLVEHSLDFDVEAVVLAHQCIILLLSSLVKARFSRAASSSIWSSSTRMAWWRFWISAFVFPIVKTF